jgi:hypothetical protein
MHLPPWPLLSASAHAVMKSALPFHLSGPLVAINHWSRKKSKFRTPAHVQA